MVGARGEIRWSTLLLLTLAGAAPVRSALIVTPVHGDYVEARTASVFAGACHYNGERVTEGRSAVLAWTLEGGWFNGVELANVRVVAVVECDDNLAERSAARRSVVIVDADSDSRAAAAAAWIESRCTNELGSVSAVQRGDVVFNHSSDAFHVVSPIASLSVAAMPDHACCTQPELVWYHPLMPVESRRVGYTESASVHAASIGAIWDRSDENSAFYGHFEE